MTAAYAELQCLTPFSFLEGASHADELVVRAKGLGLSALGVADRNTLAGVVRAHAAAKTHGLPLLVGARLDLEGAGSVIAYPKDREAYGRLSQLITLGRRRADKGDCLLRLADLEEWGAGMVLIALNDGPEALKRLHALAGEDLFLGISRTLDGGDGRARIDLARSLDIPLVATNDVLMHAPARRPLADVMTCIRAGTTIDKAGRLTQANGERHLKSPEEMATLFADLPDALAHTQTVVARVAFSLDELAYDYPEEIVQPGETVQDSLERLTWIGARDRYPGGVPAKVRAVIEHELRLIGDLGYAPYFLTVQDLVRFARSKGILCQGRGSAANSAVCYCLGVTAVDPSKLDLLFERFVSAERDEPPDIDVDFEHERREEVIQYVYEKYGRDRAGMTATVIRYRARGAIRDVGKAMGLGEDTVTLLASQVWGWSDEEAATGERLREIGLDPEDRRLSQTLALIGQMIGFPRHLSQHVGGMVMTQSRLDTIVPIENAAMADRTVIQWDKDDLDELGILKVDLLSLGMLSCLRKGFDLLRRHYGREYDLATIPPADGATYDMLCRADSIGVFQVESRAQMAFLPRMRPRDFYDLVIEVAIVRPGPIQGDMVHPYLRRRNGEEPVDFPSDELRRVLGKTLGVPLFQEQAMQVAIVAAGFTPSEADRLRRAMATFRKTGIIHEFHAKMVRGMVANGYDPEFAERCFKQIEGFGEYGFPESHAASFALLVYVSAWMKCHYPAVFACALLNSQPMGFYAPAQIVRDAADHGVDIRPPDVNCSDWDCTLEPGYVGGDPGPRERGDLDVQGRSTFALRLGLRQIKGLAREDAEWIVAARANGYGKPFDLWRRAGVGKRTLAALAKADAFASMGRNRRESWWDVQGLGGDKPLPLFRHAAEAERGEDPDVFLPPATLGEEVAEDYGALRLSLKAHPVDLLRARADGPLDGCTPARDLVAAKSGSTVTVCGLVLVRQRPGSAKGVMFATLEDETGTANIVLWVDTFERFRRPVLASRLMAVTGKLQREASVVHIVADHVEDRSYLLDDLAEGAAPVDAVMATDEVRRPIYERARIAPEGHRGAGYRPMKGALPTAPVENEAPASAGARGEKAGAREQRTPTLALPRRREPPSNPASISDVPPASSEDGRDVIRPRPNHPREQPKRFFG
jgi:error-prone DNA polymerase